MDKRLDADPNPSGGAGADTKGKSPTDERFVSLENSVKNLAAGQEKMNQFLSATLARMDSSHDSPRKKQTAREDDDREPSVWDDFDPHLASAVEKTVKGESKAIRADTRKVVKDEIKAAKDEGTYNAMLVKEYPQVLDPNHPLHQEFQKIKARKLESDAEYFNRPEAVYETTTLAYANLIKSGKITPPEFKEEVNRLVAINNGMMPGPTVSPDDPKTEEDLTPTQKTIAKKFGVSVDRYIKQLKERKTSNKIKY